MPRLVLMEVTAGMEVPSVIHCDGLALSPDAGGRFLAPASSVMTLTCAGFQTVMEADSVYVP
jgi:hypothetical protein